MASMIFPMPTTSPRGRRKATATRRPNIPPMCSTRAQARGSTAGPAAPAIHSRHRCGVVDQVRPHLIDQQRTCRWHGDSGAARGAARSALDVEHIGGIFGRLVASPFGARAATLSASGKSYLPFTISAALSARYCLPSDRAARRAARRHRDRHRKHGRHRRGRQRAREVVKAVSTFLRCRRRLWDVGLELFGLECSASASCLRAIGSSTFASTSYCAGIPPSRARHRSVASIAEGDRLALHGIGGGLAGRCLDLRNGLLGLVLVSTRR